MYNTVTTFNDGAFYVGNFLRENHKCFHYKKN